MGKRYGIAERIRQYSYGIPEQNVIRRIGASLKIVEKEIGKSNRNGEKKS